MQCSAVQPCSFKGNFIYIYLNSSDSKLFKTLLCFPIWYIFDQDIHKKVLLKYVGPPVPLIISLYFIPPFKCLLIKIGYTNTLICDWFSGTPTVMMSIVLPKMLRKRRGVIVNFGSFVGEANCPYPTVYPSTKTFCHKLTRDLQVWYKDSGVTFQTVMPGNTISLCI